MADIRKDILSWVTTDEGDQQRCYNLLQEMELADENDQYKEEEDCLLLQPENVCDSPSATPAAMPLTYKQAAIHGA